MDPLRDRPKLPPVSLPPARPTPASGVNRSGALNIVDDFSPQLTGDAGLMQPPASGIPFAMPHGMKVAGAARETGYQGPLNTIPVQENSLLGDQRLAEMSLRFNSVTPQQGRQDLHQYVQKNSMSLMLGAGSELQSQAQGGTHQAVTNFSFGAGPAVAVSNLYEGARLAWTPVGPNEPSADDPQRVGAPQLARNLAGALDVPADKLLSQDPTVSGPARALFQQRLVDFAGKSANSPEVQKFHAGYAQTVHNYEAQGNSVVISAGNEGDLLQRMREDNGGREIHAPVGFFQNALATPETTVVGAMGLDAKEKPAVATYSSGGANVPVIALGVAGDGQRGTSFAAPRVAAVMEQIHRINPKMSSAEVERHMIRTFTVPVEATNLLTM